MPALEARSAELEAKMMAPDFWDRHSTAQAVVGERAAIQRKLETWRGLETRLADFEVLLDRKSTIYLGGITLDHQSGLKGRGFVFHNPHAANTCGCGESFRV